MVTREQRAISFKTGNGGAQAATLHVTCYDKAARAQRALKNLLACWAVATATVFIPLAHFVLVPSFIIAGPAMAYRKLRRDTEPNKAVGTCPACSKDIELHMEPTDALPKWTYCPSCNASLQLTPSDQ